MRLVACCLLHGGTATLQRERERERELVGRLDGAGSPSRRRLHSTLSDRAMHCAGVAQARASTPAGGHLSVAVAANHLRQNESEAAAHEAVDDEVDARVERQQEIAGDVDVQQAVARERHVTRTRLA